MTTPYYLSDEVLGKSMWTIEELCELLKQSYCGSVGVEYAHVEDDEQRRWLHHKIEGQLGPNKWRLPQTDYASSVEKRTRNLSQLMNCHYTAKFFAEKFPNSKVFGIEGCESLLPGLWSILETGTTLGVENVEVGMAHRARMNLLVNFFGKSLESLCSQFEELEPHVLSDVKFHMGARSNVSVSGYDGAHRDVRLSLSANPSHLEMVNAVVLGKVRALQTLTGDTTRKRILPILIHGDAAFSGQGIVAEVMQLSQLTDYTVGGCVHIVINNQIGFTTSPRKGHSAPHCTSVAKIIGAPIFHVNGDDVDAVVAVCRLAAEWRQAFAVDCVVDIVCYRRYGHNSLEDPMISAPIMYKRIQSHMCTMDLYSRKLIEEGIISKDDFDRMSEGIVQSHDESYRKAKGYQTDPLEWLGANWQVSQRNDGVDNIKY